MYVKKEGEGRRSSRERKKGMSKRVQGKERRDEWMNESIYMYVI